MNQLTFQKQNRKISHENIIQYEVLSVKRQTNKNAVVAKTINNSIQQKQALQKFKDSILHQKEIRLDIEDSTKSDYKSLLNQPRDFDLQKNDQPTRYQQYLRQKLSRHNSLIPVQHYQENQQDAFQDTNKNKYNAILELFPLKKVKSHFDLIEQKNNLMRKKSDFDILKSKPKVIKPTQTVTSDFDLYPKIYEAKSQRMNEAKKQIIQKLLMKKLNNIQKYESKKSDVQNYFKNNQHEQKIPIFQVQKNPNPNKFFKVNLDPVFSQIIPKKLANTTLKGFQNSQYNQSQNQTDAFVGYVKRNSTEHEEL